MYEFLSSSYFPPNFKYVGYIGLIGGIVLLLIGNVVADPPILFIALVLSFTRIGCKIEVKSKTITDFTSIVGLELGKPQKYQELKKLVLKPNEISQVLNSRGSSTTLRYTIYNAYLFYDDQSILLTRDKNKDKMAAVAKELYIPLDVI